MKKISICLALSALLFALSVSAAEAQQPGKIYRIGFLDPSNASSSAVRLKAFWEEISGLDGSWERILLLSPGLQRKKLITYLS
jgi:hypothetical protein